MRALFQELKSWERVFLILALLCFPLLSFLDFSLLHPGYCEIDEISPLRHAWIWLHGLSLMPAIFTGTLHRMAVAASMAAFPKQPWALSLPSLLAFELECLLLARLSLRLFNARVAAWALFFNLICAFSLARSRALLCYALLPCELLLVLEIATDSAKQSWRGWLAGALLGIFFLEYEAWPAACLSLACSAWFLRRRLSLGLKPLALGSLLGLALSAWLSRGSLASYVALRHGVTLSGSGSGDLGWGANLAHFFSGGHVLPSMGVEAHAAVAPWALPFLALGCLAAWRREKWMLAWLALGLLPLIAPTAGLVEANRGIAAWPLLALLAGLGADSLPEKKWLPFLLLGWLSLGAGMEARAFFSSQSELAPENYALSQAQKSAGQWLAVQSAQEPVAFLSQLGYERGDEVEWEAGLPEGQPTSSARVLAWIPWEAVPALGKEAQGLLSFSDPKQLRHVLLLEPSPALRSRLEKIDATLGGRFAQLNSYDVPGRAKTVRAWLDKEPGLDPWVRTVLWQRYMTDAALLGVVTDKDVDALLKEKLVHAGPLNYPAYYLARSRPDLAAKLYAAALKLDPRLRN